MALLLDIDMPNWLKEEDFRAFILERLPDADVRCYPDLGDVTEIEMLASVQLRPGLAAKLPKLKLVQKLGAGVETIVNDPTLAPNVRIARLRPDPSAQEIADYCLLHVLREQRNSRFHAEKQTEGKWVSIAPKENAQTTVAILGLGYIGQLTGKRFAALGFRVLGWSRSAKSIEEIDARHGNEALKPLLGQCDYVVSILPSTEKTRDLFDLEMFSAMKPGSWIINVGRGDLIVDEDLLSALDSGQIAGAVLDVFHEEPLPAEHRYWSHPKVTVTPHVSGWHLTNSLGDVAENYRRLRAGEELLYQVDRTAGY
ncbi:MAG: glyoxylate/hydroxypyruvate reductase A [Kiloniellales bacterium]|nr:glyoxylate/hydroxypyruvate reductase A [Kiloniellales bacterium]